MFYGFMATTHKQTHTRVSCVLAIFLGLKLKTQNENCLCRKRASIQLDPILSVFSCLPFSTSPLALALWLTCLALYLPSSSFAFPCLGVHSQIAHSLANFLFMLHKIH